MDKTRRINIKDAVVFKAISILSPVGKPSKSIKLSLFGWYFGQRNWRTDSSFDHTLQLGAHGVVKWQLHIRSYPRATQSFFKLEAFGTFSYAAFEASQSNQHALGVWVNRKTKKCKNLILRKQSRWTRFTKQRMPWPLPCRSWVLSLWTAVWISQATEEWNKNGALKPCLHI